MTNTLLLAAPGSWLLIDKSLIRNIPDFSQSDYKRPSLAYGDKSLPTSVLWCGVVWCDNVKGVATLGFYNFLWELEILLLLINQFDILNTTIFLIIEVSPQPEYFWLTDRLRVVYFDHWYSVWLIVSGSGSVQVHRPLFCIVNWIINNLLIRWMLSNYSVCSVWPEISPFIVN